MSFLPCAKRGKRLTTVAAPVSQLKRYQGALSPLLRLAPWPVALCLPPAAAETHLGWISRWSGDGLVVMEDDEDQIPVTIEEMPAESWH